MNIEITIARIRESHPDMERLYMEGQCYNFFLILRSIAGPEVEPWYDHVEGHIYSRIGPYWYDIRGKHLKVSEHCEPLSYDGHLPHRWGKNDTRRLDYGKERQ